MNSGRKRWTKMSLAELREATKEFEKPTRFSETEPLRAEQRAKFERGQKASRERAKRKP